MKPGHLPYFNNLSELSVKQMLLSQTCRYCTLPSHFCYLESPLKRIILFICMSPSSVRELEKATGKKIVHNIWRLLSLRCPTFSLGWSQLCILLTQARHVFRGVKYDQKSAKVSVHL